MKSQTKFYVWSLILLFGAFVYSPPTEAHIFEITAKLPTPRPNTQLVQKPLIQSSEITHKSASFVAGVPVTSAGRNEIELKSCRGGGNKLHVQLARAVEGETEPKWVTHRNVKQTDEGITVGTLKPGTVYLLRTQCEFKYNLKPHHGEWSDKIEFTTLSN